MSWKNRSAIWENATGRPPVELRAAFAASAMEGVIRWWLTQGHAVSVEQAAAWVWQLLSQTSRLLTCEQTIDETVVNATLTVVLGPVAGRGGQRQHPGERAPVACRDDPPH